jgi:predicted RND superfamily exporter protein
MYNLLSPLSKNLKKNLLDLLYMYHGSLYSYDENWTMSIEQFVNYLHGTILKDSRFADKINSEKRADIERANEKIADAEKLLVGKNHSRAILNTSLREEGDETFAFIEQLKTDINSENAHVFVIGNSPMALEMSKTFNDEMNFITILTMISIFVVVAITFKSILIPVILVLIIQSAVWITMSILSLTGSSVYFIAIIIVQAILMGATIDYGILFTCNYIEERRTSDKKQAIGTAMNRSVKTILTSSLILIGCCLTTGLLMTQKAISQTCSMIACGTAVAVVMVVFVLPLVIYLTDKLATMQFGRKK